MNLKNIKDYWHLLEAAKEGKIIEWLDNGGQWVYCSDNCSFNHSPVMYRVKPEPVVQEFWVVVYANGVTGARHQTEWEADEAGSLRHHKKSAYLYTRIEDGVMVEQKLIPTGGV